MCSMNSEMEDLPKMEQGVKVAGWCTAKAASVILVSIMIQEICVQWLLYLDLPDTKAGKNKRD